MGERVVINPATRIHDPGDAADTPPDPGVRLDYARSDLDSWFPTLWAALARLRAGLGEFWLVVRPRILAAVAALGGWRQVGFALGMGMICGGLGACLVPRDIGSGTPWMFLGRVIVGLCLRIPLWR